MPFGLSDFRKEDRGPRLFDLWSLDLEIPSALGPFVVELMPDVGEPDQSMSDAAAELVQLLASQPDRILERIVESYLKACSHEVWMRETGVAIDLEPMELPELLRVRAISIVRDDKGLVLPMFYFSPAWDQEHGLYLAAKGAKLIPVRPDGIP